MALALLAAVALGGCAGLGTTTAPPANVSIAQATHEYPAPKPSAEQVSGGGSASAVAAVRAFANAYINWTAATVARRMLALAASSVGQARSAMALAASQTAADYELKRGGIANSGTVEAVAQLAGRPNRYVVVTRERTTATATDAYQGLAPAWHVTIATVRLVAPGVWAVSGWQPEG